VAIYPLRGVPAWEPGLLVGGDAATHQFTVQVCASHQPTLCHVCWVCVDTVS
jgi:hypothetical protein